MKLLVGGALFVALVAVAGCGGDSSGPGDGYGTVTATVSGTAFAGQVGASPAYTSLNLSFRGAVNLTGGEVHQIDFFLTGVSGPKTITLGPGVTSTIKYIENTTSTVATWTTLATGGSGSVTITLLETHRATGTYTITLTALAGTIATGTKTITGSFDITIGGV